MLLYNHIIEVKSVPGVPYIIEYLAIIYRMSKYCLPIPSTRLNNVFWTFFSPRNNKCEWFVEINEALL